MEESNKFDYNNFYCEILTPDGISVDKPLWNEKHSFYSDKLILGLTYYLIFTYEDIFLMAIKFRCTDPGKVIYLSPSHIIAQNELPQLPDNIAKLIEKKSTYAERLNIQNQEWMNIAMERVMHPMASKPKPKKCKKKGKSFKAGNELSGQVK